MTRKKQSDSVQLPTAGQGDFLCLLNDALIDVERSLYRSVEHGPPCVFVVGLPRSGTTLLLQVVSSALNLGYINNLIARFWRAPVSGIRLSRMLLGNARPSSFKSAYGRTEAVEEPHEFGHFWRELLAVNDLNEPPAGHAGCVDWNHVQLVLRNMVCEFGSPLVLKGFIAQWYLSRLADLLPDSLFIRMHRDPVAAAYSLVGMRRYLYGAVEPWASLVPREAAMLADRPYWEQVAGQVYFLGRRLDAEVADIDPGRILEVQLADLRTEPAAVVEQVAAFLAAQGSPVESTDRHRLRPFEQPRGERDADLMAKIERAYRDFSGS